MPTTLCAYVATSGDGEPSDKVLNLTPGSVLVSPESRNENVEKVADRRKRIRRHCQTRTNKHRLQVLFLFLILILQ